MATFGREVENAMDQAAEGAKNSKEATRKRQLVMAKYMKKADGSHEAGTFRDPAAR